MIVANNCCNGIISSAIVIVALVLQMPIYITILICKNIYINYFVFYWFSRMLLGVDVEDKRRLLLKHLSQTNMTAIQIHQHRRRR
jgi:hypothetical protein